MNFKIFTIELKKIGLELVDENRLMETLVIYDK